MSAEQYGVLLADHRSLKSPMSTTAFTPVLDPGMKEELASEMCRAVKPEGLILRCDYHMNKPRNPDVKGVKRRKIYALFPDCDIHLQRITLAPPIARRIATQSWLLCYVLSKIPWLCSHYIGVIARAAKPQPKLGISPAKHALSPFD